jgi:hypothetical protein
MPVLVPVLVTCLRASAALRSQHPFIANAPDKAILAGLLEQVFKFSEVCLSLSLLFYPCREIEEIYYTGVQYKEISWFEFLQQTVLPPGAEVPPEVLRPFSV